MNFCCVFSILFYSQNMHASQYTMDNCIIYQAAFMSYFIRLNWGNLDGEIGIMKRSLMQKLPKNVKQFEKML